MDVVLKPEKALLLARTFDERSHVPATQRAVHGVAQEEGAVRTDAQARDGVAMALERVHELVHAQVPRFDDIVNPSREDELLVVRERNGRHRVLAVEFNNAPSLSRVPQPDGAVVAATHDERVPASRDVHRVDNARVPREFLGALAFIRIPKRDCLVGRR